MYVSIEKTIQHTSDVFANIVVVSPPLSRVCTLPSLIFPWIVVVFLLYC